MNVLILLGFLLSAFGLYLPRVGFGSPYRCAIATYHSYIGCTPNIVSDFLIQLQFAATAAAAATDWVVYLMRFFVVYVKILLKTWNQIALLLSSFVLLEI